MMDDSELLELLRRKESSASHYVNGTLATVRENALRAYHRMPYGNEEDGWSTVVTSDVMDTVEWILPALLKTFSSTDRAVSFEPSTAADVQAAEQATDACNYVFYKQNNGFLVLYTAIKDALTVKNCAVHWRKETKETVSTIPFKGATAEVLAMLTEDGSEIMQSEESVVPDELGQPVTIFSGRLKKTENKTIIKVEAFNPNDLLVDEDWTSPLLADCPYTARMLRVTLSDLKLMGFKDVEEAELRGSYNDEQSERLTDVDKGGSFSDTEDEDEAEGYLRIEYVLADLDEDGIAELNCIHRLEGKILSRETCSHVPFATFSPIMNTHRWDGLGMEDVVGDLQKLHTEILRQTLNNLYLTNNPRSTLLTDSAGTPYANIDDFLNSRPGGAVRQSREGAIQPLVTPFAAGASMPVIDYIKTMREERTGVSRTSQGLNPDSLNNTATGRALDQSSAQQRIELIARNFAEICLKPIFCGILKLLTDGEMEKLCFRLRDQFVEYDPNEWRDQYDMTINVGLGTGDANSKIQALQMIMQNQVNLLPMGLADPEKIYNTQAKIVEATGFKDVQNFIVDPRGKPAMQPPPNPMLQIEQMKQQGIAQKAQFDAQQKQQEIALQDQQHQREMQRDMEIERNKQEMQARDAQFQAQLEEQRLARQAQMEEYSKQADRELQRWKAELDASVKLQIAGIKSPETIDAETSKEDALMQTLQALATSIQGMNAPKVIVRDNMGKAIGVQAIQEVNNGA